MRVLIPFTVLFLSGCSHLANDHWSGQDKAQHFMASAMLSAAGNEYARHQGVSPDRSDRADVFFESRSLKRTLGQPPGRQRLELERFCLGCRWRDNRLRYLANGAILKAQALSFTVQHQRNQESQNGHRGNIPEERTLHTDRF